MERDHFVGGHRWEY